MDKVPVVYSEEFLTDYRTVDCENPDRVTEIYFKVRDVADFIEPYPCSIEDLRLCHGNGLIQTVERNGQVFRTASKAAGGAIRAAEISLEQPAFALIRPPGHHAGRDFNGGFCFFNNMAVALYSLLSKGVIGSALVVDIDLHYGNGTYDIVSDDRRITFNNIESDTRPDFFEQLENALTDSQRYDVVACSAGFDTYIRDWGNLLFTEDYRRIGNLLASSNTHFFSILEGGYYIPDLGTNVRAYLEGIREACSS
jgi:acetoin utilization deacetylase AcuC-like enzyme